MSSHSTVQASGRRKFVLTAMNQSNLGGTRLRVLP